MFSKVRPLLPALALVLAQSAGMAQSPHPILPPQEVAAARALEPQRTAQAQAWLASQSLGLGMNDQLEVLNVNTNNQGQTIIRFQQTHQGSRVFGSMVVVRANPEGTFEFAAKDVLPALNLPGTTALTAQEAIQAAHAHLNPQGPYAMTPTAERVVFPAALSHGLKMMMDPTTKKPLLDRDGSLVGPRPTTPFLWAYDVQMNLNNAQDGFREMHLIVSASTGQVLKKWDDAAGFLKQAPPPARPLTYAEMARRRQNALRVVPSVPAAFAPPASRAGTVAKSRDLVGSVSGLVPVKGWGNDLYQGKVVLDTVQSPLGTGYDLVDITRAKAPHRLWQITGNRTWFWDASISSGFAPPSDDFNYPYGNNAWFNAYTMADTSWSADGKTGAGSVGNVWGDGLDYNSPYAWNGFSMTHTPKAESEFHYGDPNGQTAAVGAHFAMQVTYDMYKNVLGRLSLDGQDMSLICSVHDNNMGFSNAHFDYQDLMMHYGDGTWYPGATDPMSYRLFTSVTIGGHEMSHGEMHFAANVGYYGEGMGINEGNSDIMGMCVTAYAKRGPDDPADSIPEGVAPWTIAAECSPAGIPLRWMERPSKDGISPDAWYYGIGQIDGHYSMAVPNRFFYFLSQGASSDATRDDYSPYLPQGMAGIGINAAARIWYKAVNEYMTANTVMQALWGPLNQAATDLYGKGSTQLLAVQSALAAVNLGPAPGTQGRPLVTFPEDLVDPYSPLGNIGLPTSTYQQSPYGLDFAYYYVPIIPVGERMKIKVNVANATDTSVKWSTGWDTVSIPYPNDGQPGSEEPVGPSAANGAFDADGTYHAPLIGPKFSMVKATSSQDLLEFGFIPTLTAMLDTDGDGDQDAVDMAAFALSYGLPEVLNNYLNPQGSPTGLLWFDAYSGAYIGYGFDDFSLQAWNEAFMNAFAP